MKTDDPCPIPRCDGKAEELTLLGHYCCSNSACVLASARLSHDAWQSLLRQSVLEVPREVWVKLAKPWLQGEPPQYEVRADEPYPRGGWLLVPVQNDTEDD